MNALDRLNGGRSALDSRAVVGVTVGWIGAVYGEMYAAENCEGGMVLGVSSISRLALRVGDLRCTGWVEMSGESPHEMGLPTYICTSNLSGRRLETSPFKPSASIVSSGNSPAWSDRANILSCQRSCWLAFSPLKYFRESGSIPPPRALDQLFAETPVRMHITDLTFI